MLKEQKSKAKKLKKWEVDQDYIAYCKRGDSAAVFITRDSSGLDTTGKWIDITFIETSSERNDAYYQNESGRWYPKFRLYDNVIVVKSFVAELFPRLTKPDYSGCLSDESIRYETWYTANKDIKKSRKNGFVPRRYHIEVETFSTMEWNERIEAEEKKWHYRVTKLVRISK